MLLKLDVYAFNKRSLMATCLYEQDLSQHSKVRRLKLAIAIGKKGSLCDLKEQISQEMKRNYALYPKNMQIQLQEGYDLADDLKLSNLSVQQLRVLFVVGSAAVVKQKKEKKRKAARENVTDTKKVKLFELVDESFIPEKVQVKDTDQDQPADPQPEIVVESAAVSEPLIEQLSETDQPEVAVNTESDPVEEVSQVVQPQADPVQPPLNIIETTAETQESPEAQQEIALDEQPPKSVEVAQETFQSDVEVSSVSSVSTVSSDDELEAPTIQISKPELTPLSKPQEIKPQAQSIQFDEVETVDTPIIEKQTVQRLPRLSDLKVQQTSVPGTPQMTDLDSATEPESDSDASDSSTEVSTNKQGLFALAKQQQKPIKKQQQQKKEKSLLKSSHPILIKPVTPPQTKKKHRARKISLQPPEKVPSTKEEIMAILNDDSSWS